MYYSNQLYLKANADCTLAFFVPFTTLIAIIYKYKYLLEIYTVENLTLKHSISCGRIKTRSCDKPEKYLIPYSFYSSMSWGHQIRLAALWHHF